MRQYDMKKILEIGIDLAEEENPQQLLELALTNAVELTGCDTGILYLKSEDSLIFRTLCRRSEDASVRIEEDIDLPDILLTDHNSCTAALSENRIIRSEHLSAIAVPIICRNGEQIGILYLGNTADGTDIPDFFSQDMILAVSFIASETAYILQNTRYLDDISDLLLSFVRVISSAIDERTPYNVSHTRHMARCGRRFINYLNCKNRETGEGPVFTPEQKSEFAMCVWLHDIGKLVTPVEVMNKDTRLTSSQYREIMHRLEIIELLGKIDCLEGRITKTEALSLSENIRQAKSLIGHVNTVDILTDDMAGQILALARRVYTGQDGVLHPWLTAEESASLSIRTGTLSPEERKIMENHVVLTDKLLSKIYFPAHLSHVHQWAAMHHELLDGSGYPNHLTGEAIPMEVRILTILDVFDALVADDRPYKPGMPVEKALDILEQMADAGKLDSSLVNSFRKSNCWQ